MKRFIFVIVLFIIMPQIAKSQTNFSISVSDREDGFTFSISNYYRVPEKEVIIIKERGIPEEELPVVYFIASKAKVKPKTIIDLRLKGLSWMDISLHYGIYADAYYIPLKGELGPPYGKAYGHFKKHKKEKWKVIKLDDDDIINLVNLSFMSNYYQVEPEVIINERAKGKRFVVLDKEFKEKKHKKHDKKDKKEKKNKNKHHKHDDHNE